MFNARETRDVDAVTFSYTVIPVLQFLNGQPFDDVARSYISGLRPSTIRMSYDGSTKCDANTWRVTVYLDGGIINRIEQEVEVALFGDIEDGYNLECRLIDRGVDIERGI